MKTNETKSDIFSPLIAAGVCVGGLVALIPALLVLLIVGGISFVGLRFIWQMMSLFS